MFKKPKKIDDASLSYSYCPGKATWYPEIAELFEQCRVTLDAGILPKDGNYLDQDELFVEVFPFFVRRWKERNYDKIWSDVRDFVVPILEGFAGKKG